MPKLPTYSDAIYRVWLQYKVGFNPVEIATYLSCDYKDAFDHIETRHYPTGKKCHVFVRQIGTKYKHFHFDERFYAELQAREDVNPDEFYEVETDIGIVQLKKRDRHGFRPAIWKGIRRL